MFEARPEDDIGVGEYSAGRRAQRRRWREAKRGRHMAWKKVFRRSEAVDRRRRNRVCRRFSFPLRSSSATDASYLSACFGVSPCIVPVRVRGARWAFAKSRERARPINVREPRSKGHPESAMHVNGRRHAERSATPPVSHTRIGKQGAKDDARRSDRAQTGLPNADSTPIDIALSCWARPNRQARLFVFAKDGDGTRSPTPFLPGGDRRSPRPRTVATAPPSPILRPLSAAKIVSPSNCRGTFDVTDARHEQHI